MLPDEELLRYLRRRSERPSMADRIKSLGFKHSTRGRHDRFRPPTWRSRAKKKEILEEADEQGPRYR